MDADSCWSYIEAERRSLADLLEGLSETQWESPSLCTEWRVRDVAMHLTLVAQPPSAAAMLVSAVRARGSFHRLNRDLTIRSAQRNQPGQIIANLREHADSRRLPVVTNARNVLFDILVHGQDIAMPLGIRREMPTEAARAGAQRVWSMGWPFWARRRLRGYRLVATDVDWAAGDGLDVRGPIAALLLLITGRTAGLPMLTGEGATRLSAEAEAPHAG